VVRFRTFVSDQSSDDVRPPVASPAQSLEPGFQRSVTLVDIAGIADKHLVVWGELASPPPRPDVIASWRVHWLVAISTRLANGRD
jgi:hypothetical protein